MLYQPFRSPRPPGIRLRILDAKHEKAHFPSPVLSRPGAINENYNVLKSSGVFRCGIKENGRQDHFFTSRAGAAVLNARYRAVIALHLSQAWPLSVQRKTNTFQAAESPVVIEQGK
jgi:hypothetical protein